jgi:uncharacterized membrane protein YbhN (UPF0104 family)
MSQTLPKFRQFASSLLSILLFSGAVWLLQKAIHNYSIRELTDALELVTPARFWLAVLITVLNYFVMTGYDSLALRHINHRLPYRQTGLASYISYAFSNNIGLSMLAGASVRYRLYTVWGLSTANITQVVWFLLKRSNGNIIRMIRRSHIRFHCLRSFKL